MREDPDTSIPRVQMAILTLIVLITLVLLTFTFKSTIEVSEKETEIQSITSTYNTLLEIESITLMDVANVPHEVRYDFKPILIKSLTAEEDYLNSELAIGWLQKYGRKVSTTEYLKMARRINDLRTESVNIRMELKQRCKELHDLETSPIGTLSFIHDWEVHYTCAKV